MKNFSLNSLKTIIVAISLMLATSVLFSSCQKVENELPQISQNSNIPTDATTEMMLINDAAWHKVNGVYEACLPSMFYNANDNYEYIKLFSQEINTPKEDGGKEWVEMPNGNYSFRMRDSKIYVQRTENNEAMMQFLIALKRIK